MRCVGFLLNHIEHPCLALGNPKIIKVFNISNSRCTCTTTVSVKENVVDFELGLRGFTAYRCVSFHMNHILHEILYLALGDFC